jgi:hypothetical protein
MLACIKDERSAEQGKVMGRQVRDSYVIQIPVSNSTAIVVQFTVRVMLRRQAWA